MPTIKKKQSLQSSQKLQKIIDPKQPQVKKKIQIKDQQVRIIMDQTKCDGRVAVQMLIKHNGDMVTAVLEIIKDQNLMKTWYTQQQDEQYSKSDCSHCCFQ